MTIKPLPHYNEFYMQDRDEVLLAGSLERIVKHICGGTLSACKTVQFVFSVNRTRQNINHFAISVFWWTNDNNDRGFVVMKSIDTYGSLFV